MPVKVLTSGRPRHRTGGFRGGDCRALKIRCEAPTEGGVTRRTRGAGETTVPEEKDGGGGLGRSGGILAALPIPLGSASALGLAGPKGTPEIGEFPAPAEPAGGVSCANALAGNTRPSAMTRTSAALRNIGVTPGADNDHVWRVLLRLQRPLFPLSASLGSRRRGENQT
jgi:hypothetical protein